MRCSTGLLLRTDSIPICYINDLAIRMREIGNCIGLFADDAVIYCYNYNQFFFIKTRLELVLDEI